MNRLLFFLVFVTCLQGSFVYSQEDGVRKEVFTLEGRVVNAGDFSPIAKVNIEITGRGYTTTDREGNFSIKATVGDELVVRSDAFETVYYKIKDKQKVTIQVQSIQKESVSYNRKKESLQPNLFQAYIDSARVETKKDAKKSIEHVTKALEYLQGRNVTAEENAIALKTLGDINLYWQLPDLAISNYKQSLRYREDPDTKIQLALAYRENGNYQESISLLQDVLKTRVSNYQKILVYEGLGDCFFATHDLEKSIENYQNGLELARKHKVSPKIIDLNSKIGEAFAQKGEIDEAQSYFTNSLSLSKQENKKRAVEEKNKVADFYNQKRDFSKEIELRQEALDELETLEEESEAPEINSPLTPQRQNYKIANAFVAQDRYQDAIPFLEKSIREADEKEDLIVQKDATRKLSEIYRDIGNFDKAAETYERYVEVVDELYVRKEQELSRAARFNKEITLRQNRINSLETERQLSESRYQLAVANQELAEKSNTIQKWIIASLAVIAVLLLYVAYTQRQRVHQQRFANNLLALKSLRSQMNPHFIFNALNSVNSFIATNDERAANKYLSEFSQLMRAVLENSEEDFIPLSKEIELLELYVKLEHFRFQDKFDYTFNVDPEIDREEYLIPPMLLQPYVENSVWHGLRYKEEKGQLIISFQQQDPETVLITIQDDGIGRDKSKALKTEHQKKQNSKGMGNITKRIDILNTMYKDKITVKVENVFDNGEGTLVSLQLKRNK